MTDTVMPKVLGTTLAHALDGANMVDDLGSSAPGDYGDVAAEYELLRDDAAVVDRSVGGAVRVEGPDARSFLDSLVSQDLTDARRRRRCALVVAPADRQAHCRLSAVADRCRGVLARYAMSESAPCSPTG